MTCIVACVGLIPGAFSTGIGSQVQRPLALVVVGGMLLAPVLILLVLPVLIMKFSKKLVDAVRLAGTRCLGRRGAARQSRRGRGAGRAAPGAWRTRPRSAAPIFRRRRPFDASRERDAVGVLSPNLNSGEALYNLYTPQVTVSYVPDVFGANRRAVESLAAQEEASRYQLDATYLTLTANVVTTAIQEAALRAQIAATERVIALEREALRLLRRQLELGASRKATSTRRTPRSRSLEATLAAAATPIGAGARSARGADGHLPADLKAADASSLEQMQLPADIAARGAVATGRASSRCAGRRGATALGNRAGRRRDRQSCCRN
jgi:hypothetical protein